MSLRTHEPDLPPSDSLLLLDTIRINIYVLSNRESRHQIRFGMETAVLGSWMRDKGIVGVLSFSLLRPSSLEDLGDEFHRSLVS
jgi:hypothetical protein